MKEKIIICLALLSITQGCKKQESAITKPQASFYFKKTVVTPNEIVGVDNFSTNANSYTWEDKSGVLSSDKNPSFSWNSEGTFTVKLTVTGSGGSSSTERSIVVKN